MGLRTCAFEAFVVVVVVLAAGTAVTQAETWKIICLIKTDSPNCIEGNRSTHDDTPDRTVIWLADERCVEHYGLGSPSCADWADPPRSAHIFS